jgi:signal transduction histidine kinase
VQEISRRGAGDQAQCQFADIVMRESDRLDRIIEDFLRYARSAPFDLRPLELLEVLEQAVVLIKSRPELCGRALKWEKPADRFRVYGDRDHLLQVFLNLGINALQATPAEGGVLEIQIHRRPLATLRGRWDGEEPEVPGVEIVFRDNGHGMEPEQISKAFTPFFTTKEQGTGLGLSIVERFVREHKGLVDIESSPGQGAAVRVRLPLLSAGGEGAAGEGGSGQQRGALAEGSERSTSTPEALCNV